MDLCLLHVVAIFMAVALIGALVIYNMEQLEEYESLRQELNEKTAELAARKQQQQQEKPEQDPVHFTQIVNNVVGDCVQDLMREVREFYYGGRQCRIIGDKKDCEYISDECSSLCEMECQASEAACNECCNEQCCMRNKMKEIFLSNFKKNSDFKKKIENYEKQKSKGENSNIAMSSEENYENHIPSETEASVSSSISQNRKSSLSGSGSRGSSRRRCNCKKCSILCPQSMEMTQNFCYKHVNYADSQLGARIVAVTGTPFDIGSIMACIWGNSYGRNPPEYILNSNMEPGYCFAFKGEASVTILLSKPISVEVIEVAHIGRHMSPTRETSSAPKDFSVYGVENQSGRDILIGHFCYENKEGGSQMFSYTMPRTPFQFIKFVFHTNHGNPDYTCVYKVGVYGREFQ